MQTESSQLATRRSWIGLAVIALPCLVYAMDLTVFDLAVPQLTAALSPSSDELLWILDIYSFVLAGALITMGALGDRIGRRRLLMTGATAFGVLSIAAACSTGATMLIVTRGLLGLAGATLAPSTLSLITAMFRDERQRKLAIGIWGASFSAGTLLGPVLGGIVLAHASWRLIFVMCVPAIALLLAIGPRLLPEVRADETGAPLDVRSAALSLGAILGTIYGAQSHRVVPVVIGLALAVAFVHRQRKLVVPLVDLAMFRIRSFTSGLVVNLIGSSVAFAIYVFVALELQVVRGLSPVEAGLWITPAAVGFLVGSLTAPLVARRLRATTTIACGLVLAAAGALVLAATQSVAGLFVLWLGLAVVPALATVLVVENAPPERATAAAAISETASELGGALGIAVLGSIGTALYLSHGGIGTLSAAATSPTTRAAFATAFTAVALIGATLFLACAAWLLATARAPR